MAKEPSDIEKPPLPFKGARLSKSRPLPLIPVAEGSSSTQPKDTKRESHLLVKARDTAENNQQPKGDTDPPVHDSGTSTPIIRRSSRVDNMSSEIPPPPEYGPYNADYDYHPSLGIMSHDKHLNEDGEALYRFLIEHGTVPPKMHLRIEGTHKEEVEVRGGSSSADDKETTIITVRDFFFVIELSPYILNDPVWWSESDDTPAFRGAMNMQIEPNGPVPPSSRVGVSREERKAQEAWEKERENRGIPPWMLYHRKLEEQGKGKARADLTECSSRTIRQWADDYAMSRKGLKDFKFKKVVYGWDFEEIKEGEGSRTIPVKISANISSGIRRIIMYTSYGGDINVEVENRKYKVHVRSSGRIAEKYYHPCSRLWLALFCIYPILWLWRHYFWNGGGEWVVAGTAWPMKKWVKVEGSFEGETIDGCILRLQEAGIPFSSDTEFKLGHDGVYYLKGFSEARWLKTWTRTIAHAVETRVKSQRHLCYRGPEEASLKLLGEKGN